MANSAALQTPLLQSETATLSFQLPIFRHRCEYGQTFVGQKPARFESLSDNDLGSEPATLSLHMDRITELAFWQLWQQIEQDGGERRVSGLEVELIGCHQSEPAHVDPSCPMCHRVRSELVGVAHQVLNESGLTRDSLHCGIDPRSNSVLCLPALGNRSAVCVSITLSWKRAAGQARETELLRIIKSALSKHGIYQR